MMGISLTRFLNNKKVDFLEADVATTTEDEIKEYMIREMAFNACVNLISKTLASCEFKTFKKNKEVKKDEYYRWNFSPNANQTAEELIDKAIHNLFKNNEALIAEVGGQTFVVDSYSVDKMKVTQEYVFENIAINGVSLNKTFKRSEVIFLELNNDNIRKFTNETTSMLYELISKSVDSYKKSKSNRGILEISTIAQNNTNFKTNLKTLTSDYFKKFFDNDDAVLPMTEGFKYNDLSSQTKTYSGETTRDIRALIDDVYEVTAKAFNIPLSLIKGDVQDTSEAMNQLMTVWIKPLAKKLEQAINFAIYGKDVLKGDKIVIDISHIKGHDIFDLANNIDKLVSSALFSVDDLRMMLGFEPIGEDWAKTHYMTKNYSPTDELTESVEGNTTQETDVPDTQEQSGPDPAQLNHFLNVNNYKESKKDSKKSKKGGKH